MKIDAIEPRTTSTGKAYYMIGAEGQKGSTWEVPTFKVGDEVDGEFYQKGDYTNFRVKRALQPPKWLSQQRGAAIEKAQDTKREDIAVAQERKHDAIKLAGAMRDATLVTLASLKEHPFPTDDEFKREWTGWVKFFLGAADQPFI